MSRTHYYTLAPEFAAAVAGWRKWSTIRRKPKRGAPPAVGDKIVLRRWVGKPYRKGSTYAVALTTTITEVCALAFADDGDGLVLNGCTLRTYGWPSDAINRIAHDDGFADWPAMRDWFVANYPNDLKDLLLIRWSATNRRLGI